MYKFEYSFFYFLIVSISVFGEVGYYFICFKSVQFYNGSEYFSKDNLFGFIKFLSFKVLFYKLLFIVLKGVYFTPGDGFNFSFHVFVLLLYKVGFLLILFSHK